MTGAAVVGLGAYRPDRVVTNTELMTSLDTTDEWIRARTGFISRRIARPDETVADMSVDAAAKALADAGMDSADVDLVLLATCTLPTTIPGSAAEIAHRLGTRSPGALDVNAGCAGFCYALAVAADAINAGSAQTAMVIGAERLSDWVDWSDRSTAILFGDGAGAAVVCRSAQPGIGPVHWGSDGALMDLVDAPQRLLQMQGPQLFRWATTALPEVARAACARAAVPICELRALVCHQANLRIIDALVRSLALPVEVVVARDGAEHGNTSAASIPLALTALRDSGAVATGDAALLVGFGAGLTYAAQVVRCP